MTKAPNTETPELLAFTNYAKADGVVHAGHFGRFGAISYCQGRRTEFGVATPEAITCKTCLRKLAANGIDPQEVSK